MENPEKVEEERRQKKNTLNYFRKSKIYQALISYITVSEHLTVISSIGNG